MEYARCSRRRCHIPGHCIYCAGHAIKEAAGVSFFMYRWIHPDMVDADGLQLSDLLIRIVQNRYGEIKKKHSLHGMFFVEIIFPFFSCQGTHHCWQ